MRLTHRTNRGGTSGPNNNFPLSVHSSGRYLVRPDGQPFSLQGDTAWSLAVATTQAQATTYLDDRQSRGYTAILFNVVEHLYCAAPPANAYGEAPFSTASDFSTPREAYFSYIDWLVQACHERGMLAILVPAYHGYNGGSEGWYSTFASNGTTKLQGYGEYLETRLKAFPNVLYVQGGDYDPPDLSYGNAIATGIRNVSPSRLQTAHCNRYSSALDIWSAYTGTWLNVNTTYTYEDVYTDALVDYARAGPYPFFMIESAYELNPWNGGFDAADARLASWQTMLSGGCGWIYGHRDVWGFGYGMNQGGDWVAALASEAGDDQRHLRNLLESIAWTKLVPKTGTELVTTGLSTGAARVCPALASDASYGLVWVPTATSPTVNLAALSGPNVLARWFDPTNGSYTAIGTYAASGTQSMTHPGTNSAGANDWCLRLDSVA